MADKRRKVDLKKIEQGVRYILEGVGEDPKRGGLKGTPQRVAHMFSEILGGLQEDPSKHLSLIHEEKHDEMVLIKNIPLYSMCEHHLLPFAGVAHVAADLRVGQQGARGHSHATWLGSSGHLQPGCRRGNGARQGSARRLPGDAGHRYQFDRRAGAGGGRAFDSLPDA